jgi:hypothetical protein
MRIFSRIRNPTTEQTVLSVAGITQYGTLAAEEFLTNEAYFAEVLKHARNDWLIGIERTCRLFFPPG